MQPRGGRIVNEEADADADRDGDHRENAKMDENVARETAPPFNGVAHFFHAAQQNEGRDSRA